MITIPELYLLLHNIAFFILFIHPHRKRITLYAL